MTHRDLEEHRDHKEHRDHLHAYLRRGREAVVWKLEGLDEYDAHRPLTPTATSLLGLVKHLAHVEGGYFGETFARPFPGVIPWEAAGEDPTADMWATAQESSADVVELYERACRHADATIDALGLDAPGQVPWWPPERRDVTLGQVLVHVATETHRHAGHADIVRELVDGQAGLRRDVDSMVPGDEQWWRAYRDRVEGAAQTWRQRAPGGRSGRRPAPDGRRVP